MLNIQTTKIVNGASIIDVDGEEVVAVTMHGTVPPSGNPSTTTSIQNSEVYRNNIDSVFEDIKEFELFVLSQVEQPADAEENQIESEEEV